MVCWAWALVVLALVVADGSNEACDPVFEGRKTDLAAGKIGDTGGYAESKNKCKGKIKEHTDYNMAAYYHGNGTGDNCYLLKATGIRGLALRNGTESVEFVYEDRLSTMRFATEACANHSDAHPEHKWTIGAGRDECFCPVLVHDNRCSLSDKTSDCTVRIRYTIAVPEGRKREYKFDEVPESSRWHSDAAASGTPKPAVMAVCEIPMKYTMDINMTTGETFRRIKEKLTVGVGWVAEEEWPSIKSQMEKAAFSFPVQAELVGDFGALAIRTLPEGFSKVAEEEAGRALLKKPPSTSRAELQQFHVFGAGRSLAGGRWLCLYGTLEGGNLTVEGYLEPRLQTGLTGRLAATLCPSDGPLRHRYCWRQASEEERKKGHAWLVARPVRWWETSNGFFRRGDMCRPNDRRVVTEAGPAEVLCNGGPCAHLHLTSRGLMARDRRRALPVCFQLECQAAERALSWLVRDKAEVFAQAAPNLLSSFRHALLHLTNYQFLLAINAEGHGEGAGLTCGAGLTLDRCVTDHIVDHRFHSGFSRCYQNGHFTGDSHWLNLTELPMSAVDKQVACFYGIFEGSRGTGDQPLVGVSHTKDVVTICKDGDWTQGGCWLKKTNEKNGEEWLEPKLGPTWTPWEAGEAEKGDEVYGFPERYFPPPPHRKGQPRSHFKPLPEQTPENIEAKRRAFVGLCLTIAATVAVLMLPVFFYFWERNVPVLDREYDEADQSRAARKKRAWDRKWAKQMEQERRAAAARERERERAAEAKREEQKSVSGRRAGRSPSGPLATDPTGSRHSDDSASPNPTPTDHTTPPS